MSCSNQNAKGHAAQAAALRTPHGKSMNEGPSPSDDEPTTPVPPPKSSKSSQSITQRLDTTEGLDIKQLRDLVAANGSQRLLTLFKTLRDTSQSDIDGFTIDTGRDFIRDWIHVHLREFTPRLPSTA